jgi:hypothetical protein
MRLRGAGSASMRFTVSRRSLTCRLPWRCSGPRSAGSIRADTRRLARAVALPAGACDMEDSGTRETVARSFVLGYPSARKSSRYSESGVACLRSNGRSRAVTIRRRGCPLTKARRGPLVQALPQASTSNSVQEYRIFPWLCPVRRRETQPTAILSDRFASFQSSAWRSCSRHV